MRDKFDNRHSISRSKGDDVPEHKRVAGSIVGKFPVFFPEYRMVVYIDDPSKEAFCRKKWNDYHNHVTAD